MVHRDEVITIALDRNVRVVRIKAFAGRRGGAATGRKLYEEIEPNTAGWMTFRSAAEPCAPGGHAVGARRA
jgi:ribosomal 50S subunit-recycling heat shock protein